MPNRDRLLILAPRGRDAEVIKAQLGAAGIRACISEAADIIASIRAGTLGAAIIADEGLMNFDLSALAAALTVQPPWSDYPFLLLTRQNTGGWTIVGITGLFGNVTILERPLSPDALVSAARAALRARARQRAAEAHLHARDLAEAQVRDLARTLEARVMARTAELMNAMSEQVRMQSQLKESEELYRLTIELSAQIPWSADADGQLVSVGERLAANCGVPVSELLGEGWLKIVHPDDRASAAAAWRFACATSTTLDTAYRLSAAAGGYVWYRSRAAPGLDAAGTVSQWYGTFEDTDEHKRAEARLEQVQQELVEVSRITAMGAMASILAHELNQPLTAITNYVRGSRRMLEASAPIPPVIEALNAADRSVVRAGEIVRRARELVGGGSASRRSEPVVPLISEAIGLALDSSRWPGIVPTVDFDDAATARIYADRVQIQQVLMNLIRNALEAMAGTPTRHLTLVARRQPEDFCEITVSDTGPGIDPEVAAQLFDPFHTTKAGGQGIGLSICRTIVEAHGGNIWSRPGEPSGTVFGFTVPCG